MTHLVNRRQVLKLIAASTTAAAMSPLLHARARYPQVPMPPDPGVISGTEIWQWMGRAIHTIGFYEEPDTSSARLAVRYRDQSVPLTSEVRAPFSAHNDLWYETPLGYVHSAWVYPVRVYAPQPFINNIGEWGFWGEVSQVFTDAYTAPTINSTRKYLT